MSSLTSKIDIVNIRGVRKRFGAVEALKGVDLAVPPGIIHALVGPDGAGKTTLLRVLAGIMRPSGGSVEVIGQDVAADPESVKGEIGYLSQRFSLNPVLTVRENISFFASLYRVPLSERKSRVERLLQFSRLESFVNRQAGVLSGGMKQKLSLCCALIHTPRLLLLDEPTTGVDPISRRELWEILYDLLAEGVTVILSTPYMDEAERAGGITLLHNGRSIMTGDFKTLQAGYGYTLYELLVEDAGGAYESLSRQIGTDRVSLFGDRLHLAFDKEENQDRIRTDLENSGIRIVGLRRIEPGLEDIFIEELSGEPQ